MATKRRSTKKRLTKRRSRSVPDASGGKDRASARKWRKGQRIEAYTFGEALGKKNWP